MNCYPSALSSMWWGGSGSEAGKVDNDLRPPSSPPPHSILGCTNSAERSSTAPSTSPTSSSYLSSRRRCRRRRQPKPNPPTVTPSTDESTGSVQPSPQPSPPPKTADAFQLSKPKRRCARSLLPRATLTPPQRRQHAFEAARSAPDLDPMEDLSLGSSDSEGSAFEDAAEEVAPVIAKEKRKAYRPKHKAWARDLLQHAETLDLGEGLPKGLEKEWAAMVVPKGKRCLCASGNVSCEFSFASGCGGGADAGWTDGYNTVLLSRVAGRTIARRTTVLPPDCLLDCVFDAELGLLWVLDVIKWRGTWCVPSSLLARSQLTLLQVRRLCV